MPDSSQSCPCGSGVAFCDCCEPYLLKRKAPHTAEALMRSRYTAFVKQEWMYLCETTHPKSRKPDLLAELKSNEGNPQWMGLDVLNTTAGGATDKHGKVHFAAHYFINGKKDTLEEHSRFKRHQGRWMYVDAKG